MKKIMILIGLIFIFTGCSRIIDALWNPDTASFDLRAAKTTANTITLTFTKSDHLDVRQPNDNGSDKYFWGYYVYRNEVSPYDAYSLIGIEAQEILNTVSDSFGQYYHSKFQEKHKDNPLFDDTDTTNNRTYIDTVSCGTSGNRYFYRVVSVYRDWDTSEKKWKTTTSDEDKSTFAAVKCE